MTASPEDIFVREVLAQYELVARHAARSSHVHAAEFANAAAELEHSYARDGARVFIGHPNYPNLSSREIDEERAKSWAKVDALKAKEESCASNARAWLRIRTHLLAALVAEGGEQLYELGEVPPTERQPRAGDRRRALGLADEEDEREPVRLDKVAMVEAAERNGLMQEDTP
jgi:hypothetical protein